MRRIAMGAAVLAVLAAACGSSGDGPGGVDRSKQVSSVTDADKAALCDWFAPMAGGYGATHPCAQALITAPPDKATCIAEFPVCAVTVGAFADCVAVIVAAQNTCTDASLAAAVANPACSSSGPGNCF